MRRTLTRDTVHPHRVIWIRAPVQRECKYCTPCTLRRPYHFIKGKPQNVQAYVMVTCEGHHTPVLNHGTPAAMCLDVIIRLGALYTHGTRLLTDQTTLAKHKATHRTGTGAGSMRPYKSARRRTLYTLALVY